MTNNVIQHPRSTQAVRGVRFLHPQEMSEELSARLVAKMEMLAGEAYLDGRRRGFKEGWINGATVALCISLLIFIFGMIASHPLAPEFPPHRDGAAGNVDLADHASTGLSPIPLTSTIRLYLSQSRQ
jgi:hypothetical protein